MQTSTNVKEKVITAGHYHFEPYIPSTGLIDLTVIRFFFQFHLDVIGYWSVLFLDPINPMKKNYIKKNEMCNEISRN